MLISYGKDLLSHVQNTLIQIEKMSKRIRFQAIGDPHISKRHLNLSQEAIAGTLKLFEKRPDVDIVTIMGDILDRHDDVKLTFQRMAIDWIRKLVAIADKEEKQNGRKIVIAVLIGNHDRPSNQDFFSEIHPFMGMEDISGRLLIVNKPKAVAVNGSKILFMPYVPPGRFIEGFNAYLGEMHKASRWLSIKSIKDFSLIFAHQEFEGAPYGPITSLKGDKWPKEFPTVISGHIHSRMWLQENILYTGSLYPITTAESNDKGVICGEYDPDTHKIDFKTTRVVMSQKTIIRLNAKDADGIREMVNLDRENTKYIVQGTSEEIASVKPQVQGKGINIAYDVRVLEPSTLKQQKNIDYDEIIRAKAIHTGVISLLEEIMA